MARHGNDYGPNGQRHDEFGALPEKRIENMHGTESKSITPVRLGDLKHMALDFFERHNKKPTELIYPGTRSNVTTMGVIIDGLGFVSVNLHNIPNAEAMRLE